MHIEPGVVNGAKIGLSYLTGAAAIAMGLKMLIQRMFTNISLLVTSFRCLITTIFVFSFFRDTPPISTGCIRGPFYIWSYLVFIFWSWGNGFWFGCRFVVTGALVCALRFATTLHKYINFVISFICSFLYCQKDSAV